MACTAHAMLLEHSLLDSSLKVQNALGLRCPLCASALICHTACNFGRILLPRETKRVAICSELISAEKNSVGCFVELLQLRSREPLRLGTISHCMIQCAPSPQNHCADLRMSRDMRKTLAIVMEPSGKNQTVVSLTSVHKEASMEAFHWELCPRETSNCARPIAVEGPA